MQLLGENSTLTPVGAVASSYEYVTDSVAPDDVFTVERSAVMLAPCITVPKQNAPPEQGAVLVQAIE